LREQGTPLDAALARPRNKFAYEPDSDLADLAAAYTFAIAKTSHPFMDGNKRTAFVVAVMFLILNGYTINHSEDNAVRTILAVADGSMNERDVAAWFREGMTPA
jgi:death-on-curing protein